MLHTQYNIVAVLPQYNISTVQEINTCVSLTSTRAESGMVCFHYHYSCDISIVQELSVLDYAIVVIIEILLKHIRHNVESAFTLKIL